MASQQVVRLDSFYARVEKGGEVFVPPDSCYARWRRASVDAFLLKDSPRHPFPEKLLQMIWAHQRLKRDSLFGSSGERITVLHPGFWNREAGPDFQKAVVQIGEGRPRSGDIEIDLDSQGWLHHGHDKNPKYRRVILHIVWSRSSSNSNPCPVPTLSLEGCLDSPIEELRQWLLDAPACPPLIAGKCTAPLQDLPPDALHEILRQAAEIRFQLKAHEFLALAKTSGWDQALWEGLFTSLGYKQNPWPMRRLAELKPRWHPDAALDDRPSIKDFQRRLLGISGLIPNDPGKLPRSAAEYTQELWQGWWRERNLFEEVSIPPEAWQWNGIRPANHPQRRIALAAHWLADATFIPRLETWIETPTDVAKLNSSLLTILTPQEDVFWNRHWTLRSRAMDEPKPLLGPDRTTDIAMNVLLPWAWIRARLGHNDRLQNAILSRYLEFPAGSTNTVMRLAQNRLFAGKTSAFERKAALQQGVHQIVRDFCNTTDAVCTHCRFPELVRSLGRK